MNIIDNIANCDHLPKVATIGFFDGVHKGHQFLIHEVERIAAAKGYVSTLVTFANHPRQVLQKDFTPFLLSTQEEKLELLQKTRIDLCILFPFTVETAAMPAQTFMEEVLHKQLNVKMLIVGYDHHFGKKSNEEFDDYRRYGEALGMEVLQAPVCTVEESVVSSSAIRKLLLSGNIEQAEHLLGHPYSITGKVVEGEKIGRTIGFPTANIACEPTKLIPADGVYAVRVQIEDKCYKGMLNIGCRPTLKGIRAPRTIEVHLLHFNGDLYGKTLSLIFVKHIRKEQQFASLQELTLQLQQDADIIEKL